MASSEFEVGDPDSGLRLNAARDAVDAGQRTNQAGKCGPVNRDLDPGLKLVRVWPLQSQIVTLQLSQFQLGGSESRTPFRIGLVLLKKHHPVGGGAEFGRRVSCAARMQFVHRKAFRARCCISAPQKRDNFNAHRLGDFTNLCQAHEPPNH